MKICLCGSTRFIRRFYEINSRLTRNGHIVYSVAVNVHDTEPVPDPDKEILDLVHLRKIIESEAILVIGSHDGGLPPYIGDSTRREMAWANINNIPIYYENELHVFEEVGARVFRMPSADSE